jgi:two-component system sensor histidine kinase BaeS
MTSEGRDQLAVLVHEVRSPVAALAAVSEALADTEGGPARRELARLAVGACRAIERIVGDLPVASVHLEPVDVGALVRDVVSSNAVTGISVVAHVDEDLPFVDADPVRLRQALDNLVSNALVHGASQTIVVRAARSENCGVALSVADEGPGIAANDRNRIFDRGVRLDDSKPGSGLGLSITRAIVEAHAGTIVVDSTVGKGTLVTITLSTSQSDT